MDMKYKNLDLLILDYHLSLLSGLDILKILHHNHLTIPALILSSRQFSESDIAGFDLHSEQILSKGKPIAEILQNIEQYLESYITH